MKKGYNERRKEIAKTVVREILMEKVSPDKRKEYIEAIKAADSKEARIAVLDKFGVIFSDEEAAIIAREMEGTAPDEEIDVSGGGCSCSSIDWSCAIGCMVWPTPKPY